MSMLTIQLGQCGNQVGSQLFDSLYRDSLLLDTPRASHISHSNSLTSQSAECILEPFFSVHEYGSRTELRPRAVLVDMEPKVVRRCLEPRPLPASDALFSEWPLWRYRPEQTYVHKCGSGNNWAYGYNVHAPRCWPHVAEIVRKQLELCDHFGGFLILMSLAGGTGSGVGARLTEELRDEYRTANIVNQVVWPYEMGEVCVQNYNALLTLAHLLRGAALDPSAPAATTADGASDGLLVVENELLHAVCQRLLAVPVVTFAQVNRVLAEQLVGLLQSARWSEHAACRPDNSLGRICELMCSVSEYRLLSLRALPHQSREASEFSTYTWPQLIKYARQMLVAFGHMEEGLDWSVRPTPHAGHKSARANRSIANLLLLRGADALSFSRSAREAPADCESYWSSARRHPLWPPLPQQQALASTRPTASTSASSSSSKDAAALSPNKLREQLAHVDTFVERSLYAEQSPAAIGLTGDVREAVDVWYSERPLLHYARHATLLSNSQLCVRPLAHVWERARHMFDGGLVDLSSASAAGASVNASSGDGQRIGLSGVRPYVHHYAKYNIDEAHFLDAFRVVEQTLADYRDL